jgi:hypothetical protein
MPAINPNGQEGHWIEGAPFRGLSSSAITGAETFWFEGTPARYLFPTATVTNKGIMWWLIDF